MNIEAITEALIGFGMNFVFPILAIGYFVWFALIAYLVYKKNV